MTDFTLTQQIEIVLEGRKRGFTDSQIAGRLGLPTDDAIFTIKPTSEMLGIAMSGLCEGFHEWELAGLPIELKRKILILAARSQESGYRRGAQQAAWAVKSGQKFKVTPDDLRFGNQSLDSAKMMFCGTRMTSLERLRIQHGSVLAALGLDCIEDEIQ